MRIGKNTGENLNKGGEKFKIICIDDEQGVLDTAMYLFEKSGYEIEGYTDHNEGIEKIRNNTYDLLILDFMLNNFRGDQVVKIIREFNNDLYILLLTGYAESAPPLETMEKNNIQGYCTKSNDTTQLQLLVKSAYNTMKLIKLIKRTQEGLSNILKAVPKIYQLQPLDIILEEILRGFLPIVKSDCAFIMVDNIQEGADSLNESFFKGVGQFDVSPSRIAEVFNYDFMEFAGIARTSQTPLNNGSGIFIPLIHETTKKSMGILYFETDKEDTETSKYIDLKLLEVFATQASSSISNAFLHSLINIKNEELSKTYEIIKKRYEETIDTLRLTVDAKDEYTRGHSDRVASYSIDIAKKMGSFSEQDLDILRVGGVFHDIGKIGTTDDILLADRKLSDDEFEIIKRHPLTGANILSALSMFSNVVPLVKSHHEKFDGTGYPMGLKGEEIPILARIIATADAFDAMTTNRSYRGKLALNDAIQQLEKGSHTQFDPKIVEAFVQGLKDNSISLIEF